jgi:hypothetical protein
VNDSARKVNELSRELSVKEDALLASRLGNARLDAERIQVQEKAHALKQENEQLLLEKHQTKEELLAAKMYVASIEKEKKKADILDRFVKKHGDRMNDFTTISKSKWQKHDGTTKTKEIETKLHAAVKRGLPQVVPLVNQILSRLEEQELSLREYSEREVDFINLLVELVSDQPATSLKQMIQEEMRKLHGF